MGQATLKFDFETQFQGILQSDSASFKAHIEEISKKPADFVECGWDLTNYRVETQIKEGDYVIKLLFTIVVTDDEDLISDSSYTDDMIATW